MKDRNELLKRAKELRKNETRHEKKRWYEFLRTHPAKFKRQRICSNFSLKSSCCLHWSCSEETHNLLAQMAPVMRMTQKSCFEAENIGSVIHQISSIDANAWPSDEHTGKPFATQAKLSAKIIHDTKIYTLKAVNDAKSIVLYLHGGAFLYGFSSLHAEFCDDLAVRTGAEIVMPFYQRIPGHHCEETYEMLNAVYCELLKSGRPVIFAGDSSGGGLALGFAAYCRAKKLSLPLKLILISPWLDLSLSDPKTVELEEQDMMLARDGLKKCGALWAGDLDLKDPRVSPIFGDLSNLPEMLIFVGTNDLMLADAKRFYEKAKDQVKITLIIAEELYHIFALSKLTAEGRKAQEMMVQCVSQSVNN